METPRSVLHSENEGLVTYLLSKKQELVDSNSVSENLNLTLSKVHRKIAACRTPIKTIKDLSQIKGVGKWILRLMQGFFSDDPDTCQLPKDGQKGKKTRGHKRYVPQKNSVAYALLITLYRKISNGKTFLGKEELTDAAEASGLSRTSIVRDKGIGKPGQLGSSPRDWYAGWSCMKTLISKGLVVKSCRPAKYMLTEEGKKVARECLIRSGLVDNCELITIENESMAPTFAQSMPISAFVHAAVCQSREFPSPGSCHLSDSTDCHCETFGMNIENNQADTSDSVELLEEDCAKSPTFTATYFGNNTMNFRSCNGLSYHDSPVSAKIAPKHLTLQPCTSFDHPEREPSSDAAGIDFAMPPRIYGDNFKDIYEVILILDDREKFGSRKVVDILRSQFKIQVEVRHLPVGDGIWIARHRYLNDEYVLDFIVERKRVDDLRLSIRDNRYRDQKLRLLRCGLQKLIYLVEGDPNMNEAAESIKTACFTTEILEGFDVQRTSSLTETLRKYGYLTQAIDQFYAAQFPNDKNKNDRVCPSYKEFIRRSQNLEKMTISDLFALQLVQVPQVTEDIALAVVNLYPTLLSLAEAYTLLDGDVQVQEEMLKNKTNLISRSASRNIFRFVWG